MMSKVIDLNRKVYITHSFQIATSAFFMILNWIFTRITDLVLYGPQTADMDTCTHTSLCVVAARHEANQSDEWEGMAVNISTEHYRGSQHILSLTFNEKSPCDHRLQEQLDKPKVDIVIFWKIWRERARRSVILCNTIKHANTQKCKKNTHVDTHEIYFISKIQYCK